MPPTATVDERPDYLLDDEFFEQQEGGLGKTFRRFDDSHLWRFMWVAGDDIPVNDRPPSRFWGLYEGEVIRKRRLMPVPGARSLAAFELPALTGLPERVGQPGYLAPFEMQAITEGFERENSVPLARRPKAVAYEIMGEYEKTAYGPALFEHAQLMGEDKKDLVRKLYRAVVPPAVKADPDPQANRHWYGEGALKPQTRKGVKFLGLKTDIFLDQWRAYLRDFAAENVRSANLPRHKPRAGSVEGTDDPLSEHDLALYMLGRMAEACDNAWAEQTSYLESSKDQIIGKRNGGKGKRWYDVRDERYLLETGTIPLNLEEAMAASRAAEANESAFMRGVDKIVERINPPVSQGDVTAQIQRQVEDQLGNILDQMSPEMLQAVLERKLRAQTTLEAPVADPEERREQARKQRRETEIAARRAADVAAAAPDGTTAGIDDEIIAPLDDEGGGE